MAEDSVWLAAVSSVLLDSALALVSQLPTMPAAGWTKLSQDEIRLAFQWYDDHDLAPSEIAKRLDRDKSVITRLVIKRVLRRKQGRPVKLTKAQVQFLKKKLDELIRKADAKYTVTVAMLKKAAKGLLVSSIGFPKRKNTEQRGQTSCMTPNRR